MPGKSNDGAVTAATNEVTVANAMENKKVIETAADSSNNALTSDSIPENERKYKVEKLRENCMQLFGITTSTFDGAFYGSKETEMTISEANATVNKWLGRKEG